MVEQLRSTYHEEFIDMSFVAYWDQRLRSFLGFIIFVVILLSLRLFRNRPVFAKLGGVYRRASYDLVAFAVSSPSLSLAKFLVSLYNFHPVLFVNIKDTLYFNCTFI